MIYWDYNATTPLHPDVARVYAERIRDDAGHFGNPSSVHQRGRHARALLDEARQKVARILHVEPKEVCFTGSGSEADALALRGLFRSRPDPRRNRIVTSAIEHPAVLGMATQLEREGAEVVRIRPGADGRVTLRELDQALTPDTALCSLMWANNETGVLQPVQEAVRWCRERGILFHTDAVQAVGKVPVRADDVDAHVLSLSAHKFGGPAGSGVAVVRRGVQVSPVVAGHQELGRRGGTQSSALAAALAHALELATESLDKTAARVRRIRDDFERALLEALPEVRINGASAPRIPNTSNVCFSGTDGEALLIALDLEGICVSSGAACASGTSTPSHVLRAMGLSSADAQACIRFSLGPTVTADEAEQVLAALRKHVPRARALAG